VQAQGAAGLVCTSTTSELTPSAPCSVMEGPDPADIVATLEASAEGNLPEVRRLVLKDRRLAEAETEDQDFLGKNVRSGSPLVMAALGGHLDVIRWLVDEGGADVNRAGELEGDWTPLCGACASGSGAVVTFMLNKGADPGPNDMGWTPLMTAAVWGGGEGMEVLLAHGCGDVDHCDEDGYTASYHAVKWGHARELRLLVGAGADWRLAARCGPSMRDAGMDKSEPALIDPLLEVRSSPSYHCLLFNFLLLLHSNASRLPGRSARLTTSSRRPTASAMLLPC
jgi:ankyrin repeat protein